MNKEDELVATWVQYYLHKKDSDFWAFEQMEELVQNEPENAWNCILKIMYMNSSDTVLGNLSAGPLEELLFNHGGGFIDRVETLARQNPKFTKLIKGVWVSEMPKEVKTKLVNLQARYANIV